MTTDCSFSVPTPENCPNPSVHGRPFLYCPYCSWVERQDSSVRSFHSDHLVANADRTVLR